MLRKTFLLMLTAICCTLIFTGCWDHFHSTEPMYGSGNIVTERRYVSECTGIDIKSAGDVSLIQGRDQSIVVEADDNIIDHVITRNENGTLVVGLDNGEYSNTKVHVYVTLKTIQKLAIDGAGNISVSQPINTDNLETVINGAGNISINGVGNFLSCVVNGAGNIQAERFVSNKVEVTVNGAGNCTINVTDELIASVNGVGSVYYYGNPAKVKTYVGGIGRIVRK